MKIRRYLTAALCLLLCLSALLSCSRRKKETTTTTTSSEATSSTASSTVPSTVTTPTPTTSTTTPAPTTTTTTVAPEDPQTVLYINEICASNDTVLAAPDGAYYDYIELYNPSDKPVSLAGWGLSDSLSAPYRSRLRTATVPAHGYLVLYAAGLDVAFAADSDLYLAFKITSSGEEVFLTDPEGQLVDSIATPALKTDRSYGRMLDGDRMLAELRPTPGVRNQGSVIALAGAHLEFSAESGFYDEAFQLEMSCPGGCEIYYTVNDCENPATSAAALRYQGSIEISDKQRANHFSQIAVAGSMYYPDCNIDKATVVRAVIKDGEGNVSDVFTKVYFVGYETKEGYENLSVVSIVTDPSNFYNSSTGIFVNGNWSGKGREYERPATFTLFDADKNYQFTQTVGIRIQGASTRASQQKNLSVFARDSYDGNSRFVDPIFDGVSELKSIVLRNDRDYKFIESFLMEVVEERNIDVASRKPCVLFIEGEYYGIYNMYVRVSDVELAEKYDVEKDDVVIIKKNNLEEGTQADLDEWNAFLNFLKTHDMSIEANYRQVEQMMDIQSYIDFVCAQVYTSNGDWAMWQNIACWKTRVVDPENPYADGKWRWIFYDLDFCFGFTYNGCDPELNAFTAVQPYTKVAAFSSSNTILWSLLDSEEFCRRFVITFCDMANVTFDAERCNAILEKYIEIYAPNMHKHYLRFNRYSSSGAERDEKMYRQRTAKYFGFFPDRFDFAMAHLKAQFGLTTELTPLTVALSDPEAGRVTVNTATPTLEDGTATLYYYVDYAMTASAEALDGYTFVGWELEGVTLEGCTASDGVITFRVTGESATLRAVYAES